jgi:hypothetical protein
MRRKLHAAGIGCNDWLLGLGDSGAMTRGRMLGYLARLPGGVSELYVHAAVRRWDGREAWPVSYDCRGEFEALVDAEVRRMAGLGLIERGSFARMAGGTA